MIRWFRELDDLLQGKRTRVEALGRDGIDVSPRGLAVVIAGLAATYGACMGSFALWRAGGAGGWQFLASTIKTPLLFFLTLLVTMPSLYVFSALAGSRLRISAIFRLLMASIGVMVAVLASLGPIVAFFGVSTTSYFFMVLLNVVVFGGSGLLGMIFLQRTMQQCALAREPVKSESANADSDSLAGGVVDELLADRVRAIFNCWLIVFGLVGAQMSWVLRPFVGDPAVPFTWLRPRGSSFFEAVVNALLIFLGLR